LAVRVPSCAFELAPSPCKPRLPAAPDIAALAAENIEWQERVVSFRRKKTAALSVLHFGREVEAVLRRLPGAGLLFPRLAQVHEKHRAQEFRRRCRGLKIEGVTLHSYRYAWAQRAKVCGYPERFAQEALGHNSKAVHRAYARGAQVKLPALEDYEKAYAATNIIPLNLQSGVLQETATAKPEAVRDVQKQYSDDVELGVCSI